MTTYKEIFGKPIKVLTGDPAPTPITYTVTVANPGSGNVYYIDGVQTPTLELYEGNTYNFDYSAATGHPFRFATAADAAGSTEYTTGVSVDSNITTIVVASGAPNLFYYCTNHSGMGGRALTPASPSEYEGQIWYNSTLGSFRSVVAGGAWRSGTSYSTAGYGAAGSGSLTAGLIAGRNAVTPSADVPSNATEEWNGSGWTTGGNLSNARYYAGALGTQTASLITGGDNRPPGSAGNTFTELYNGSSWTSGTAYPTAVTLASGLGTTPAGLMLNGGYTYSSTTNEYNGSWTSGGSLNTARRWVGTAGSQTAGLAFGGQIPPSGHSTNLTEEYGGTSWTSGGNLNAARAVNAVGGGINQDASQTNALASGGYQSSGSPKTYFNETEAYDGTSWTAQPTMATARGYGTGGGTGSAGIVVGAYTGSLTAAVEEFSFTANTVTAAAWSSGGNVNTARYGAGGAGIQTAALMIGGETPRTGKTESYDGTSWTEVNDLTTARNQLGSTGTSTAALAFGGEDPGPSTHTETWDGSSWSEVNNLNTSIRDCVGFGNQTAAVKAGGFGPATSSYSNTVEKWDGTNWTAAPNALPAATAQASGFGTSTAGVFCGGIIPGSKLATTYEWDGTNWTASGSMNTARANMFGGMGTQTDGLIAGGNITAVQSITEAYDGSVWSTRPNMATARQQGAGLGTGSTTSAGLAASGYAGPPGASSSTEEFTGETTALNYKNISSS